MRSSASSASVLLASVWLWMGCGPGTNTKEVPSIVHPPIVYTEANTHAAIVQGFVWDPEAFWFSVAMCGPSCAIPPLRVPGVPMIERSEINGAQVTLFDTGAAKLSSYVAPVTKTDGAWFIENVETRAGPPFLMFTAPPASTVTALKQAGPPSLPAVPASGYLPTLTLKPIFTRGNICAYQVAALVSTTGILDAVAKYLKTSQGKTYTPGDFIDPAKFGGVAITWLYAPAAAVVRVPAENTGLKASAGTVLNIDWAPPGALPSTAQSPRGFVVSANAVSNIGLTVTLLSPLTGPPTPIQFTPVDHITDAATGRPFAFPPLPPLVVAPGLISFNELPALVPGDAPPPAWICLE